MSALPRTDGDTRGRVRGQRAHTQVHPYRTWELDSTRTTTHRRSIRLPDYDYSQPGAYFVTVITQDRLCLFGDIENGAMEANDPGRMIERW